MMKGNKAEDVGRCRKMEQGNPEAQPLFAGTIQTLVKDVQSKSSS